MDFIHTALFGTRLEQLRLFYLKVHSYDGKALESRCIAYIHEHAKEVLKSRTFNNLCSSCLEQIVKSDEMIVEERLVLEAVLKWSQLECKRRSLEVTV